MDQCHLRSKRWMSWRRHAENETDSSAGEITYPFGDEPEEEIEMIEVTAGTPPSDQDSNETEPCDDRRGRLTRPMVRTPSTLQMTRRR